MSSAVDMTKPKILLDIDQTLVSAEPVEEYNFDKNKEKAAKFVFHDMDGYYIVFERPGVQEFLDFLFKNFTVSIWTAASKDYALFIIEKVILKKDRKLDYIFFSYHCDISEKKRKGTKDLSLLWKTFALEGYDEKNTMILDDYDEVYKTQKSNCVLSPAFEFKSKNSHEDNFLIELRPKLEELAGEVQRGASIQEKIPVINESFHPSKKKK